MAEKTSDTTGRKPSPTREDRLKAALKANLSRRKAQARARSDRTVDKTGKTED